MRLARTDNGLIVVVLQLSRILLQLPDAAVSPHLVVKGRVARKPADDDVHQVGEAGSFRRQRVRIPEARARQGRKGQCGQPESGTKESHESETDRSRIWFTGGSADAQVSSPKGQEVLVQAEGLGRPATSQPGGLKDRRTTDTGRAHAQIPGPKGQEIFVQADGLGVAWRAPCCAFMWRVPCCAFIMIRMNAEDIVRRIQQIREQLDELAIEQLWLVGSFARGEEISDSDVDFVVEFRGPATLLGFTRLSALLEQALGRKIDLTTKKALRPELASSVMAEALRVA